MSALSLDDLGMLRSAQQSLPVCGLVHNQEDDTLQPYDPALLTHRLQQSVLAYVDRPPRTVDGRARWYALLGPRQAGKSVVGEYAFYPKAAYSADWDHVTIADKDDRAQYLHGRVQFLHTNWKAYKMETRSSQAVRQLTFKHGGRMRTLSAREADAGIGQSISSLHACLAAGTEIVMADGELRNIEDCVLGDLIRTHTGAIAPVVAVSRQVKPLQRLTIRGMPEICATAEHRFWTPDGWQTVAELVPGALIGFPIASIAHVQQTVSVPMIDMQRAHGGGRGFQPTVQSWAADYEFGRLLGLYLAEGTVLRKPAGGTGNPVAVSFGLDRDEVDTVFSWLQAFAPLCTSITRLDHPNSRTTVLTCYGRVFAEMIEGLCGSVARKHPPVCWRRCGDAFLRGMVHGYVFGDGSPSKGKYNRRISTVSIRSRLSVWLRDALAALGYGWATIRKRAAAIRSGRNEKTTWVVDLCGAGADTLGAELGWAITPRIRKSTVGASLRDGYAWCKVVSIEPAGTGVVFDMEIGHADHSYCTVSGATHNSECGIWPNGERVWQLLEPAMLNRKECTALFECTPVPEDAPSMEWWRDLYMGAKRLEDRWFAGFFPFWDSKLCVRPWPEGSPLDTSELRLLDRWGAYGLRREHLAFRRERLNTTFRAHPELFDVFYPSDDQSCWLVKSSGVIPAHVLSRHLARVLVPWRGPVMEYEAPVPGGVYIIGADPAGFGVRDHAAFHVFRVWRDELVQVCTFADNVVDPVAFASALIQAGRRYNNAMIVVESNGVGAGTLALLKNEGYPRLFHEAPYKPGVTTTSKSLEQMLGWLLDGLMDTLTLRDEDTIAQLGSYKNDKRVEDSVSVELLRGSIGPHRRKRHHWDKVSALLMVMVAARYSERPSKPVEIAPPPPAKTMGQWTLAELHEIRAGQAKPKLRRGPWRVRLRKR